MLKFALVVFLFSSVSFARQGENPDIGSEVRQILAEATNLASQIENPEDRAVVCVRIGKNIWRSGDKAAAKQSFEKALAIIDTLPRDEHFDEDTREIKRASIASVQANVGDLEGAQRTLAQIKDDNERSMPLSDIALAYAREGDFDRAVAQASAIQEPKTRDQILEMIANGQAETGDVAGATKLARSIKTASYRAVALAEIAAADKEQGQSDEAALKSQEAVRTASQSEANATVDTHEPCVYRGPRESQDVALQRVASTQASSGDVSGASETLTHIKGIGPRENVLAEIAEAQAAAGDLSGAQNTVATISRDTCKGAALSWIAQALFDNGNLSGAIAVANTITVPSERANRLNSLGVGLIEDGHLNSALEVLRLASEASKLIPDDGEKALTLETIAEAQARAGSPSEAAQTLGQVLSVALAAHKSPQKLSGVLRECIELETELGDFDTAMANLALLVDTDRVWVVQDAARARAKTGDTQGALAWASRQASKRDKALALVGVAEGILFLADERSHRQ